MRLPVGHDLYKGIGSLLNGGVADVQCLFVQTNVALLAIRVTFFSKIEEQDVDATFVVLFDIVGDGLNTFRVILFAFVVNFFVEHNLFRFDAPGTERNIGDILAGYVVQNLLLVECF